MGKKIIIYLTLLILITLSMLEISRAIFNYISQNFTIRESFYFVNDVNQKGTHWGAYKQFYPSYKKYKHMVINFKLTELLTSFSRVMNVNPANSNFKKEYELVTMLYDLSEKSQLFKRETAIYIPKTLDIYWDISCDSHMPPFIAPGITGMAMIEGLPFLDKNSCYTHLLEYGYADYYSAGKQAEYIEMSRDEICERAKKEGFVRVIEITENNEVGIVTITHECVD